MRGFACRSGTSTTWIESAARNPDWTEPEPKDRALQRRFKSVPEAQGRILRVVCAETETTIRIISVMFDRNARRKS
ncbi:DUF4258 domain-containing protein [Pseudorhodoplanes sp.]|uniref:DUF4258 domain-containing protein n=1 Tax=Pseudorhodoplanes sp. TaxID=1934341 RepID=UPI003D0ECBB8